MKVLAQFNCGSPLRREWAGPGTIFGVSDHPLRPQKLKGAAFDFPFPIHFHIILVIQTEPDDGIGARVRFVHSVYQIGATDRCVWAGKLHPLVGSDVKSSVENRFVTLATRVNHSFVVRANFLFSIPDPVVRAKLAYSVFGEYLCQPVNVTAVYKLGVKQLGLLNLLATCVAL